MSSPVSDSVLEFTADIISAYVSNNAVQSSDLPLLISQVHGKLEELIAFQRAHEDKTKEPAPAVNPKKSVFKDYIICLENGKKFKSLKRHLSSRFNMTPDEYRLKWGLPQDYPMVAPNYAAVRSELAKSLGLGLKRKKAIRKSSKKET
jgi:predicted transcriptional regulator